MLVVPEIRPGAIGDARTQKLAEAAEKYKDVPVKKVKLTKVAAQTVAEEVQQLPPEKIEKARQLIKKMGEKMKKRQQQPRTEEASAVLTSAPIQPPSLWIAKQEPAMQDMQSVAVIFGPDDRHLWDYLQYKCREEYRRPDQQILYMLDCQFEADREAGISHDRI